MLSFVYFVFAAVQLLQFSVNGLTRRTQIDACHHLEKPPDSNVKLHFLRIGGNERQCCGCPPGYYVGGLCSSSSKTDTICKRCEPPSYIEEFAHDKYSCLTDDLVCPANTIKIPSQPDQAPRCDCYPGHYKTTGGQCEPHSSCPPGEGVESIGNPFQDTKCKVCSSGYESPEESASEGCALKDSLYPPHLKPTLTTSTLSSSTPPSSNTNPATGIVYGVFTFFGLIFLFGISLVCWSCYDSNSNKCSRRRSKKVTTSGINGHSETTSFTVSGRLSPQLTGSRIAVSKKPDNQVKTVTETVKSSSSPDIKEYKAIPFSSDHPQNADLPRSNIQQPRLSLYHRTMNAMKEYLSGVMNDDAIFKMYRIFTRNVDMSQETFISELKKTKSSCEKFCEMFEKLKLRLGEDEFNPKTIHRYFVGVKEQLIADNLKKYLLPEE